jgi:voltage-gated potassium channel Kch
MKKITWRERLHYEFDNLMARGTIALLVWLALLSVLLIVGVALVDWSTGVDVRDDGSHIPLPVLVWMNLLRTLDSGTMGGDTGNQYFLGSMLLVTLGGIFIVSTLIGIISNGISSRLEELRKGRSFVVEKGHTIILGWSPTIFTILRELGNARAHENKCIVILADRDKVAMEDEIHTQVGRLPKTRIVCRTGNPLFIHDLEITNPDDARAIIIPAPEADDPDAHVVKMILALVNRAGRRAEAYHIVAELQDADNLEVARRVAGAEAEFVLTGDLLARLTVQTCRQSGLSVIYEELLAFHGNEIYTLALPPLTGKTYGEALLLMDSCVLMGVKTSDGRALLNPRAEFVFQERDQAIVIAPDIAEIRIAETAPVIDTSALMTDKALAPTPERTLLLGWNRRTVDVITGLDAYVIPDSQLTVVCDQENAEAQIQAVGEMLSHQTLRFVKGSPTNRRTLERLRVENYDHVVIVNPFDDYPPHEADAHAMITLLHLRALDGQDGRAFSITSEILDPHNRELSEVAQPDDFIVSTQLVSLMLVQLAENPQNANIFTDLFSPEGMEIYLRPIDLYVSPQRQVKFSTLLEAALRRGETAIGYRLQRYAHDPSKNYGVVLNPNKSEPIALDVNDRLVVVAES